MNYSNICGVTGQFWQLSIKADSEESVRIYNGSLFDSAESL